MIFQHKIPPAVDTFSSRRTFLGQALGAAGVVVLPASFARTGNASQAASTIDTHTGITSESLVKVLFDSMSPKQRETVCFPWDYKHPKFGLLRTRVANNWTATEPDISGTFLSADQKKIVRDIFEHLIEPEWHARFDKQLEDDTGGFGNGQSIALMGTPGNGPSQFLLTGRHMTLRCDGNSADHVAFGGPIFYGHDAGGFNEGATHSGNVFWPQALAANGIYTMLDGKQRKMALVPKVPPENAVAFRGKQKPLGGIPVSELSKDQRTALGVVLGTLLEPFRTTDRQEATQCLEKQGGLDACSLAFYQEGNIGNDEVWDNWRLEGPSFVWHYRGSPHVHVWVNIADSSEVATNS